MDWMIWSVIIAAYLLWFAAWRIPVESGKKALQKVAQLLGGKIEAPLFESIFSLRHASLSFSFKGRSCTIQILQRGLRSPSLFVRYSCPLKRSLDFHIKKRGPLDRSSTSALDFGDPNFQKNYLAWGETGDAKLILENIGQRMKLHELLKDGGSLSIEGQTAEFDLEPSHRAASFRLASISALLDPAKCRETISRLAELLDYIEEKKIGKAAP